MGQGTGQVKRRGASEERVVQTCQRGAGKALPQMRKPRHDGWTIARRTRFIAVLADTLNVREAARAVHLHPSSAYDLKKRDPQFLAQWNDAIEQAYSEVEMRLLRECRDGTERVEEIRKGEGDEATLVSTRTVRTMPHGTALHMMARHMKTAVAVRAERERLRANDADVVARMRAEMDAMEARFDAARAIGGATASAGASASECAAA